MKRTIALFIGIILGITISMVFTGSAFAMMGGTTGTTMPGTTGGYQDGTMMGGGTIDTMPGMTGNYEDGTMTNGMGYGTGGYGMMMGGGTMMGGRMAIADMTGDGMAEIVTMFNNMLIIMDTSGKVLVAKVVEGINESFNQYMSQYMGQTWNMGASMAVLNVADMNGDQVPEIIITDLEKIMVLDNTAELMYTVPLPWAAQYNQQ